jgi:hypothetical protein
MKNLKERSNTDGTKRAKSSKDNSLLTCSTYTVHQHSRTLPQCRLIARSVYFTRLLLNLTFRFATLLHRIRSSSTERERIHKPGSGLGRHHQGIVEPIHVQAIEPPFGLGYIPTEEDLQKLEDKKKKKKKKRIVRKL